MIKYAFAALVALGMAAPAVAGAQDFALLNSTGFTIERVYVSASAKQDWEEDVLGDDVLPNGARTNIRFDSDEDACLWDIKVDFADGDSSEWQGINLCKVSVVALSYDRDTGETTAETE